MAQPDAPAAPRRSRHLLAPMALWALFCAALAAGVAAHLHRASAAADEAIHARTEAVAAMAEHTLLRAFEVVRSVHDLLQVRQSLLEADEAPGAHAIQLHIKNLIEGGRFGLVQAGVVDRAGLGVWGTGGAGVAGMAFADREHVRVHLDGTADGLFVSQPLLGRTTNRWSIQATLPVRDLWGRMVGVGIVSLDPLALSRSLAKGVDGAAEVAMVRRLSDGALLARNRDMESSFGRPGFADHPAVAAARRAPAGRVARHAAWDGREIIGAYRVAEGLPLVVGAAFDTGEGRAAFRRHAATAVAAALAAALLGLQIAWSWSRGRRLRERLREEAERDPLTGLLNRRALRAKAAPIFAEARASGRPVALLLLDLDHFKAINDAHGHDAGDAVLREVAAVLGRGIRRGDLACRWGGEEMLAVLRNCGPGRAEAVAGALRAAIAAARPGGVPGVRVTASIGVAAFPGHGSGLDDLTKRADAALYAAKRSGRDRVVRALAAA